MLLVGLFAIFVVGIRGSDDASLLQQSVAAEDMRTSMSRISGLLGGVKPDSAMHRMAFDALMKSVGEAEKLSPQVVGIIDDILQLLADVLADLLAEKTSGDATLVSAAADVAACNLRNIAETDASQQSQNEAHTTLTICKVREAADLANKDAMCDALYGVIMAWQASTQECTSPTQVGFAHLDTWQDFLQNGDSTWTSRQGQWETLLPFCDDAHNAHAAQVVVCEGNQANFETHVCLNKAAWHTRCGVQSSCHSTEQAAFDAHQAGLSALGDDRLRTAGVVIYVTCLLNRLKAEEGGIGDCVIPDLGDAALSPYTLVVPETEALAACDTAPVDTPMPVADAASFTADYYSAFADMQAQSACA